MKQFHWNHLDQRGKFHKVGLLHGARTGHVLIHVNGKITSIDFKVLESKQYSIFIDEELIELNIIRHDDHYEYTMSINEEVKTPLNAARKKERKKMGMQSILFFIGLVLFIIVGTSFLIRSEWYNSKDNAAKAELTKRGLFTKGVLFKDGQHKFDYTYVVDQKVFRQNSSNIEYPIHDGDQYMVKYLPDNPKISEVHFVKPTDSQLDRVKKSSIAACQEDQENKANCNCMVESLLSAAGYRGMMLYLHKNISQSENMMFNNKGYEKLINSDSYIAQISAKCN